jgi:hypothetical protein
MDQSQATQVISCFKPLLDKAPHLFDLPRSTVDWDTSQADDFRTRGEPWTIKQTRLGLGCTKRIERKGQGQ